MKICDVCQAKPLESEKRQIKIYSVNIDNNYIDLCMECRAKVRKAINQIFNRDLIEEKDGGFLIKVG